MTAVILIGLAAALVLVGPWAIRRVYDRSGARGLTQVPELADVAPDKRGQLWLRAVSETLLQWQVVVGFVILVGIAGAVIIAVREFIPERWDSVVVFLVLMVLFIAARPFIIRRARTVVAAKLKQEG